MKEVSRWKRWRPIPGEDAWSGGHRKLPWAADRTRGRAFQTEGTMYSKAERQDRAGSETSEKTNGAEAQ